MEKFLLARLVKKKTSRKAVLKPDLKWIKKSDLDKDLQKKLTEIYKNRHQGNHYYIGMVPFVGNPTFVNENPYTSMPYPDQGFRLLALYRYWNIIQYYYPNRHLTDKDWNVVLEEYIPKFINAQNELEYEIAALQLITEINDSHAAPFWGDKVFENKGNKYAPFQVQFIENQLVLTHYYNPELIDSEKIKIGDIITHIEGNSIDYLIDSLKAIYPASNTGSLMRDISNNILRSTKSKIDIKYKSNNQNKETTIDLYDYKLLNIDNKNSKESKDKCFKLLDENIGYINLETIKNTDILLIQNKFKNTKGIIIDIRNYPETYVPFTLGTLFVEKSTPFVKSLTGNINNPGEFTFTNPLNIPKSKQVYNGKIIVLVNEQSQSRAEFTAMAIRAGENTTIIGSKTAGADGEISTLFLPGGISTMFSGIGIYYPNGTETQRIGIIPDIVVKPTIEGVKSGKDEILDKAIEIINSEN